jgi:hypothetical protein
MSCSTLIDIDVKENSMSSESRARLRLACHPELRKLLNEPSEPPVRNALCVVGFQGVGKTALVDTWRRRGLGDAAAAAAPASVAARVGDPDVDDRDSKTAGITMQPVTLRGLTTTAEVSVVDCAGHMEYYLSHEVVLRCCPGAVFIVLFRLDRAGQSTQLDEERRLMYWLKYVATLRQTGSGGPGQRESDAPKVFVVGTRFDVVPPADRVRAVEWANSLLGAAKDIFRDGVLSMPQERVHCINCTDVCDPNFSSLTDVVAAACEAERTAQRRMAPAVCAKARVAVDVARAGVAAEIARFDEGLRAWQRAVEQGNAGAPQPTPPRWTARLAPVMDVAEFAEHVLGSVNLEIVKVDYYWCVGDVDVRPSAHPAILRTVLSYLHDSGDILWFGEEGERGDTVILAPDLFLLQRGWCRVSTRPRAWLWRASRWWQRCSSSFCGSDCHHASAALRYRRVVDAARSARAGAVGAVPPHRAGGRWRRVRVSRCHLGWERTSTRRDAVDEWATLQRWAAV